MRDKVRLDSRGIESLLKGATMQRAVKLKAEQVRARIIGMGHTVADGQPLPVEVFAGVSDRARATVALAHPAGEAVQAKYGSLTKAAAQSGLDVRQRK